LFDELLASVPEDERRASMHVVSRDGSVVSAGDAVIRLMAVFPATRPAAWWARLWPPQRRKIAAQYRKTADARSALSDKVPDAEPTVVPPGWVKR